MSSLTLEFIIAGTAAGLTDDRLTVIGRNGDVSLHVNERFQALYRYKPRRYPDELGEPPVRDSEKAVSLRIVAIHAYEREVESLGEGMTGSLELEGEGLRSLAPGWVLGMREPVKSPGERISTLAST